MARARKAARKDSPKRKAVAVKSNAASVQQAQRGVGSSEDFRNLMVSMMTDVIQGKISPDVVNAACNAGRGLLRMIEVEYRASMPRTPGAKVMPISRRIANVSIG